LVTKLELTAVPEEMGSISYGAASVDDPVSAATLLLGKACRRRSGPQLFFGPESRCDLAGYYRLERNGVQAVRVHLVLLDLLFDSRLPVEDR
jgi:hypothetical protein